MWNSFQRVGIHHNKKFLDNPGLLLAGVLGEKLGFVKGIGHYSVSLQNPQYWDKWSWKWLAPGDITCK
jgi:hypothetical protein